MEANTSQPPQEPVKQPDKLAVEKIKEFRFNKVLPKDVSEGLGQPFHFEVLSQLENTHARITLYKLFRLSKDTKDTLKEALEDAEMFLTQVPS